MFQMITGRQSEGSLIRGFDNLVLTLALTLALAIALTNPNLSIYLSIVSTGYGTYMRVGLTDPRIIDTLPFK